MNSDQVISLIAILTGAVVGLTGIYQGRSAQKLTRELAFSDREATRLHEAYVGMLELAETMGVWLARAQPLMDTDPPAPKPDPPDTSLQIAAFARVDAYGSKEVRDLTRKWREQVQRAWQASLYISMTKEEKAKGGAYWPPARDAELANNQAELALQLRPAEVEARKELTEQIRVELRSSVSRTS